jgi:tetratricopeptide (TPR) repeat protein
VMDVWFGMAELERGVLSAQTEDVQALSDAIRRLEAVSQADDSIRKIHTRVQAYAASDIRQKAFFKLVGGEVREAIELFERYLITHPNDGWTYSGLATCYLKIDDLKQAEQYAKRGSQLKPDEYTVSLLAHIYGRMGRSETAIRYYNTALNFDPNYTSALYNLGCEYLKIGEFAKAYHLFIRLGQSFSGSSNTGMRSKLLNNLGVALWGLGRRKESSQSFKSALLLNPQFAKAEENLVQIRLGDEATTVSESLMSGTKA